jgi:T-complex protein 1 subunit beta
MTEGKVGDMKDLGILEPLRLKRHVLLAAAEAAEAILRVDQIVQCAPRQRTQ